MSPVPPTPAQLPEVRQTVPVALGRVMTLLEPAVSGAVIVVVKALVAFCKIKVPLVVLAVPTVTEAPLTAKVPVKLAALEIVWELMAPEVVTVPMLTKLPDESMRLVPAPAPVLMPVVALMVVPVMVLAETKASSVLSVSAAER